MRIIRRLVVVTITVIKIGGALTLKFEYRNKYFSETSKIKLKVSIEEKYIDCNLKVISNSITLK